MATPTAAANAAVQAYPTVRIVSGPAFELIAELAAFTSGPARPALESGKGWIRQVRRLAGKELIERVERWGLPLYGELASIAYEAGPPFEPARLAEALRRMPPARLRRRLVGAESAPNRAMVSEGAFDRALLGDREAQTELRNELAVNAQARAGFDRLLATHPAKLGEELASIVEAWATAVSPAFASRSMALIERDVGPKEGLLKVTAPRDALRVFTNGVDVDPGGWATEVVVIPVAALRPFIAPVEWDTTLLLVVSVADETVDAVAGGPPRRLIKIAAALGDELRLRILHELGKGEQTASELAERLDVDRTSLHHHLGILRSAGLVAIKAEGVDYWRYTLRIETLDRATASLDAYLRPGQGS
ncbi:MAG TPA: winged helix-turn-helix domain-containing protein [Solirubrobacterales bacterium]|nr:winged helix-turn-helix domain-containing protein [Solirubrobacterales bacterium]